MLSLLSNVGVKHLNDGDADNHYDDVDLSVIQDKAGKCLTEYCSDVYSQESNGNTTILNGPYDTNDDKLPILREEVEAAVKYLKGEKSPGADNMPAELIKNRGEAMISALTTICNKIWETRECPTPWPKYIIITLPKKGNLQLCNSYRSISLIYHPSKVMLNVSTQQAETAGRRDHRRRTSGL